jgi:antitoxin ParD1/3/4
MSEIERMTITMPAEMAAVVKSAVDAGDYASTSEVVRAALRDWKMKRALQIEELAALKADIDAGLADVVAGRVKDFDSARIVERGRKLLAVRSPSAWPRRRRPISLKFGSTFAVEATAARLIDKIEQDCDPLLHFPFAGSARENFAPGLRVSFSGNYAIYYLNNEREIVIVRVLHGARDAAALAEHGGFAEGWRCGFETN